MKTCTKCKTEQPFKSFYKKAAAQDGLTSHCKSCAAVYHAEYNKDNREARAAYQAKYHKDNREARAAYKAERRSDPANHLRCKTHSAFNGGLRKATKHNNGVKPVINPKEKELMLDFLAAARTLSADTGIEFEVDHIIPLSKGGAHSLSNMQIITRVDNIAKANKLNFHDYTQRPSYPRPEDIVACEVSAAA